MRALILVAVGALSLAACKNNDQHDNSMNVDENLTAENIVSNDVTAIDAVTGDAANMAADVDVNYGSLQNETGNVSAFPRAKPETVTSQGSSTSASKPVPTPVETSPSNTVINGQ